MQVARFGGKFLMVKRRHDDAHAADSGQLTRQAEYLIIAADLIFFPLDIRTTIII